MLRQTLLTNNLANVDTPGYQRQDVDFQGTLRTALANLRADGNGVSPDQESANVAENGLLYQELTQIATARNQILQSAIGVR